MADCIHAQGEILDAPPKTDKALGGGAIHAVLARHSVLDKPAPDLILGPPV
jgi:hypothetical protein